MVIAKPVTKKLQLTYDQNYDHLTIKVEIMKCMYLV